MGILNNKRNIVFLGESGSGKSEIALNMAAALADTGQTVDLFDLDQTKPLFRSRDALQKLARPGIRIHYADQMLDTPVVAPGVRQSLMSPDVYTILDIGGFDIGAKMIGRFADLLSSAEVFYIVNPYRPWSGDAENILITMEGIRRATRLSRFTCIANPHLGPETTAEEFLQGLEMTRERLPEGMPLRGACCRRELAEIIEENEEYRRRAEAAFDDDSAADRAGLTADQPWPLLPLHLYLTYEWNL